MLEPTLDVQAHDFRPDLLTIQQSPPSAWPRGALLAVVALVGALVLWSCLARLDIVATAQGRLVPLSFTKVVQPAEPGVVLDILVKEGEVVSAGQLLLRLDGRLAQTEVSGLSRDVLIKQLGLLRIGAELEDRSFIAPKGAPPDVAAQVQAQFRARRQSLDDALAQETEAMNKATADLGSAEQVLLKLRQTVPLYLQSMQAYDKLLTDGFVGEVAANEKRREYLERAQDLKAQESTVQSLRAVIAGSERKVASIRSNYRSQLENERMEFITLINRSGQELDKSSIRQGLMEIRSPSDGVVKDLAVTNKGVVVQAGSLLLYIVPKEEHLQADVVISNDDVGFIAVGQTVQLKVATYPFQKYGLLEGKVSLVSADSVDTKQQQTPSPLSYRALVALNRQSLPIAGSGQLPLSAGMLVVSEIHLGRRTVLEYLLSPVQKVAAEAARER